MDPDGKIAAVAEVLSQTNDILLDAPFMEGNLETGHRVTIRTGLPAVYWRAINKGVPKSKSTTAQVDESVGILEAHCNLDVDLASLNGGTAAFRFSEDAAFLEAMSQEQASAMFYGNPGTDPKKYLGIAPRYSTISGAANGKNILSAGGAGSDNASIYLIGWGANTVHCIFPKGSTAGLEHKDLGVDLVRDADGNEFEAYRTKYQWKNGLVVKDWRYIVRTCNIDVSNLISNSSPAALINFMSRMLDRIPNPSSCNLAFYMNRTLYSMLRLQALSTSQNVLAIEKGLTQFGTHANWMSFQGVPIRKVDVLLNTEATVS
jgi:hypothetical protein